MPSKTRGNPRAIAKTSTKSQTRTRRGATKSARSESPRAKQQRRPPAEKPDGLAFRLDESVKPLAYRLRLHVDPARRSDYSGEVEIDVQLGRALATLELHAAELRVESASVARAGQPQALRIEAKPERETIALHADGDLAKGPWTLRIAFSAALRSDLRGFYAAKSGARSYAFTQLEAADARRFFPCFDEPACKARFTISVTTAPENSVVSNNPVARVEQRPDGTKTVHFSQTPLLSSYLVAVAVGEFATSEPVTADGVAIRIVHVPGSEAMTGFALETARECLTRLAEYFALPYPYEKLDLVAVPDFEIGAMENAGAVFFRETLLLVDEASVSLPEQKRAAEVICHELAHMWYGNLVTMRWWDDLWLNEAFATWMAFDIVAKWRPEWKMWNDFGHARDSALQLDALDNTHAIYTPVATPSEATQNFDLITYEKGAAVVRMLERYLGPKVFQRGVRRYIKRHREGNTVASDLWNALSEAAGRDIAAVVKPFVEQPGFPLLHIEQSRVRGKAVLRLQQERFSARGPADRSARDGADKPMRWQVPWVGRVGSGPKSRVERHLLDAPRALVPLTGAPADFVYGNADEGGFFRPLHHPRDLPALLHALPQLPASERLGFVQHQWALVRAGYAELDSFLPLLAALGSEQDPDVLRAVVGPSDFLVDDLAGYAGRDARRQLQAHLASTFGPALSSLGWGNGDAAEPNDVRLRRAELLTLVAVVAEAEGVTREAEARCAEYLHERRGLDANLVSPVLVVGARHADAQRLATLLDASEQDPTPQARRRFRLVIADVRDPALVDSVLSCCLSARIPTQDVAFVLARLLRNPHAQAQAFDFMRAHWSELRERVPSMLVSRLIDALPALGGEQQRRAVMNFFASHPVPTATRALRQADERFRLDARFRKRAAPVLRQWLSAQAVGG
jgi:puromycin-sensitive aminopeptidase